MCASHQFSQLCKIHTCSWPTTGQKWFTALQSNLIIRGVFNCLCQFSEASLSILSTKVTCWFRLFLKCAVLVKSYLCLNCTPLHDAFFQVHCNHQRHRCACHKKLLRFKHVAIGLNEHVCNVFNLFFSVYMKNAINCKGHCAVPENIYMYTHPKKG